jgi:hypothetical protein
MGSNSKLYMDHFKEKKEKPVVESKEKWSPH